MRIRSSLAVLGVVLLSAIAVPDLRAQASTRRMDLMGTPVTFTSNVPGVVLFINSVEYRGGLPQTINFQPGAYQLVARAPGYQEFVTTFTVVQGRPQTINIVMQPERPLTVNVTFTSNAPNTILTLANNRLGRPLPQTVTLNPGSYTITAEAPGYQPLTTTITVSADTTIPLTLQPLAFEVTFTSNAPNTIITVANNRLSRPLPQTILLNPGSYTVTAEAPGFQPLTTTVTISSSATIPLNLTPATVAVQFVSDIRPIQVTVNGQRLRGNLPQTVQLPLGIASISASAPGYQDLNMTVEITGPRTVTLSLQPLLATVRVAGPVQVFVDGVLQQGEVFTVQPGRRVIRITAGGLVAEDTVNFVAGRTYDLTPSLNFSVR